MNRIAQFALWIGLFFIAANLFAQQKDFRYIEDANNSIRLFAENKYDSLYQKFDENMAQQLKAEQLKAIWEQLEKVYGKFEVIKSSQLLPNDNYWMVDVIVGFTNQDVSTKITYDSTNRIAGLFFSPMNRRSDNYKIPAYADTSLFEEKNIRFGYKDWELDGILTIPKNVIGKPKVVILVHGSGPHDKDMTIGENKIFRDIAYGLSSNGIAVFRYDKRTYTYKNKMSKLVDVDFDKVVVDDVIAAIDTLYECNLINKSKIFVAGHSLGGYLLPKILDMSPKAIGGIYLAPLGRHLADAVTDQFQYLANLDGNIDEQEKEFLEELAIKVQNAKNISQNDKLMPRQLPLGLTASFWKYLENYNLADYASKLNKPMLFLQGTNDFQTSDKDWQIWEELFGKKQQTTMMRLQGLNHLFHQSSANPTQEDYLKIGSVDKTLIEVIFNWLNKR
jgi:alpha-beta hydrolase superfamily lysophospholipase